MEDEKATLNYDCNYNLLLAKRLIRDLRKGQERQCAVKWLRYLMSAANKTVGEMQLRNDFLHYLVQNLQEGILRPPFNVPPSTSWRLTDMATLIPGRTDYSMNADEVLSSGDEGEEAEKKPAVMEKSPDGGAFLALQPVPHEGSFCYLAITTRKAAD